MKLLIEKRNASIGYDYLVFHNEESILFAVSEKLFWLKISVWENNESEKIIKIKRKFRFFQHGYWVYYLNEKFEFKTNSFYTRHFSFEHHRNIYEIYGHHKSWKYSVYLNNKQVAWWDKKYQKWHGPDIFKLVMNDDCINELIVSFCLILDNLIELAIEDRGEIFAYDGTIDPFWYKYGEIKKFNNNWMPKE